MFSCNISNTGAEKMHNLNFYDAFGRMSIRQNKFSERLPANPPAGALEHDIPEGTHNGFNLLKPFPTIRAELTT
jgi:hypothetical protein